jgi:membrane-associated phospholipid phosphatase
VPATNSDHDHVRTLTLRVLAAYMAASLALHAWNMTRGLSDIRIAVATAALIAATAASLRSSRPAWRRIGDWLPLLSLPVLYGGVRWSMLGGEMHDPMVQGWDRTLFGTDAARTAAGALPWQPLSELLHAAYFSYYGIIYAPALFLYLRSEDEREFRRVVLAFTLAMVGSFIVFILFPVEGPRYAWPAPAGIPGGPVRQLVLSVLQAGSTRGTAFPSSHMAIALAIGLAVFQSRRGLGTALLVVTALLGAGAVYGGFHYATDVIAGVALGVGCWGISNRANTRSFGRGSAS